MYEDGSGWCFVCRHYEKKAGESPVEKEPTRPMSTDFVKGKVSALRDRGITEATCKKFNYRIASKNGQVYHIADYVKDGKVVGQKIRSPDKDFKWIGDGKNPTLWGAHLWKPGGKRLIVTEGEIDAMSVSQMQNNQWPVVSVPSGAAGALKAFKSNIEYLNSFDRVDICFDSDEPGLKAAQECALVLKPGRAHIVHLSRKDPNEYLQEKDSASLVTALWNAVPYRPDGIVHVRDVSADEDEIGEVIDYPWESLTKNLYGRRMGELIIHTSGSGMGKSTVLRELMHYDLNGGLVVGVMMLEESTADTLHALMSLELNKPIRRILAARKVNAARKKRKLKPIDFAVEDNLTEKEYQSARKKIIDKGLYLYDHFGSLDSESLISRMEFMVTALGCQVIYLDHISIVISGLETGNERKDIDVLMTNLRSFVERTGCRVEAVCHLTKPDGKPFEEGGQISLRDLRGSGSLAHLSDSVLGYERDQQHEDPMVASTIVVRSLKDRFSGFTGIAGGLQYCSESGRLSPVDIEIVEGELVLGGAAAKGQSFTKKKTKSTDIEDAEDGELPV